MREHPVSDHAVLRWLERAAHIDVEAVRAAIARTTQGGREVGAAAVVKDGLRYMLAPNGVVVTVIPTGRPAGEFHGKRL
jgi:hypothetical protein